MVLKQLISILFHLTKRGFYDKSGNFLKRKTMNKHFLNYKQAALDYYYLVTRSSLSKVEARHLEGLLELAERDDNFALLTHVIDEFTFESIDLPETDVSLPVRTEKEFKINSNLADLCIQELEKKDLLELNKVVREYINLALLPEISEIEAKRMENILEMAERDSKLEVALNKADEITFIYLNLLERRNSFDTKHAINSHNLLQDLAIEIDLENLSNTSAKIIHISHEKSLQNRGIRLISKSNLRIYRNIACLIAIAFLGRMCAIGMFNSISERLPARNFLKIGDTAKQISTASPTPFLPKGVTQFIGKELPTTPKPSKQNPPTIIQDSSIPIALKNSSLKLKSNAVDLSVPTVHLELPNSTLNIPLSVNSSVSSIPASTLEVVEQTPKDYQFNGSPLQQPSLHKESKPPTDSNQNSPLNSVENHPSTSSLLEKTSPNEKPSAPLEPITIHSIEEPGSNSSDTTPKSKPERINPHHFNADSNSKDGGILIAEQSLNSTTEIDKRDKIRLESEYLSVNANDIDLASDIGRERSTGDIALQHLNLNVDSNFKPGSKLVQEFNNIEKTEASENTETNVNSAISNVNFPKYGTQEALSSVSSLPPLEALIANCTTTLTSVNASAQFNDYSDQAAFRVSSTLVLNRLDTHITANSNVLSPEGFYKYHLTDNISITPGLIWVINPGQNTSNDDVVIGTIRTSFSF